MNITIFGQKVGRDYQAIAKWFGFIIVAIMFLLSLWQYRVLTRPEVRALFRAG